MTTYHCTLAKKYDPDKHNVLGWLASEKLDGVRGLWKPDRKGFFSRSDKPLNVPPSWLAMMRLVNTPLDGEFWMGRGRFQETVSAIRRKNPTEESFAEMRYVTFDTTIQGNYHHRIQAAALDTQHINAARLYILDQAPIKSLDDLTERYRSILARGGEGLILRNPAVGYEFKRSGNLLKWKDQIDGKALVTGMDEGQGKYVGMMGALICIDDETGVCFRIGTGFSDQERRDWHSRLAIESSAYHIRWRAMERTRDNIPRHPSYAGLDEGD